LKLIKLFILVR